MAGMLIVSITFFCGYFRDIVKRRLRSRIPLTVEADVVLAAQRRIYRLHCARFRIIVRKRLCPWMLLDVGQDLLYSDL